MKNIKNIKLMELEAEINLAQRMVNEITIDMGIFYLNKFQEQLNEERIELNKAIERLMAFNMVYTLVVGRNNQQHSYGDIEHELNEITDDWQRLNENAYIAYALYLMDDIEGII
jgi:hypothetical protein